MPRQFWYVTTNNPIESWHNYLKHTLFQGLKNYRVDSLLHTLHRLIKIKEVDIHVSSLGIGRTSSLQIQSRANA